MNAKDLISNEIVPVKTSDAGVDALSWMQEYGIRHLPIVNERQFLGLISEEDVDDLVEMEQPLGNLKLSLTGAYIFDFQHVFEVISAFTELKLSILPVVDQKNNYIGCITLKDLVETIGREFSIVNPGSIIVLEISQNDYSLSEIARIVEGNDAKILNLYITTFPESTMMEVTLKLNKLDINSLMQTFTRYNYVVKATYAHSEDLDDLKERYDSLMHYLNI